MSFLIKLRELVPRMPVHVSVRTVTVIRMRSSRSGVVLLFIGLIYLTLI